MEPLIGESAMRTGRGALTLPTAIQLTAFYAVVYMAQSLPVIIVFIPTVIITPQTDEEQQTHCHKPGDK